MPRSDSRTSVERWLTDTAEFARRIGRSVKYDEARLPQLTDDQVYELGGRTMKLWLALQSALAEFAGEL